MEIIRDIIVYILLGGLLSWYFYYFKYRDIIGGFTGGVIVGLLGSVLGVLLIRKPISATLDFLQNGMYISNVDLFTGLLSGYLALYVYNKINHDKTRKDY
ncbi:MAG: hypothetical protein OEV66_02235 [Spirochaetia bacterium]|nr:hypothetical protein [Spirochaetia bacterium]